MSIKKDKIKCMHMSISKIFDTKVNSPTTLMELTKKQHERYLNNCVHLSGLLIENDVPSYCKATYGRCISLTKKKIDFGSDGKTLSYQIVNLSKTKNRFMMITCEKADCLKLFPCASCHISILTNEDNKNEVASGIVVIMFSILPHDKNITKATKWNDDIVSLIRSCKTNVLPTYDHHGTTGKCFSFGNRPIYKNVDGISVGVYVNKKSKILHKQQKIDSNLEDLDEHVASLINGGVDEFKRILPETNVMLAPILNTAFSIQKSIGKNILIPLKVSKSGSWNTHIFINGCTEKFHVEKDCAYTCIHVPM